MLIDSFLVWFSTFLHKNLRVNSNFWIFLLFEVLVNSVKNFLDPKNICRPPYHCSSRYPLLPPFHRFLTRNYLPLSLCSLFLFLCPPISIPLSPYPPSIPPTSPWSAERRKINVIWVLPLSAPPPNIIQYRRGGGTWSASSSPLHIIHPCHHPDSPLNSAPSLFFKYKSRARPRIPVSNTFVPYCSAFCWKGQDWK